MHANNAQYFPGVQVHHGVATPVLGADLSVLIPTAGQGRRMKSVGPKALVELGRNQTVLSRQIAIVRKTLPGAEITVVLGFEADRIYRTLAEGVRVVENEFHETTNVVRSLDLGLRSCIREKVLIIYGDLVFNEAAFANVPWDESFAIVESSGQMNEEEVGVTVVDGYMNQLGYDLPTKWAQILFLTGKELISFRRVVADPGRRRCFGFEVLNTVLDRGGKIRAIEPKGLKVVEIDQAKDVESAVRIVAQSR